MYNHHNDIYSIRYCAVCFKFIQNLLLHLPCIFQQVTFCYCLVTSLLCCSLWKSVYISRQLSHFLVVLLLQRKILEMPLFTFVEVVLAVHSKLQGFCVLWGFMALFALPPWQILPFLFVFVFFQSLFLFQVFIVVMFILIFDWQIWIWETQREFFESLE